MHPFYGPSDRLLSGRPARGAGLVSMAAYLTFWAVALVVARRELDARFPRRGSPRSADQALAVLRERFAKGELDEASFRAMAAVLDETPGPR